MSPSTDASSSQPASRRVRPTKPAEGGPTVEVYVAESPFERLTDRLRASDDICVALWQGWYARDARGEFQVVEGFSHVQAMKGGGLDELSIRRAVDARRDDGSGDGPPLGWIVSNPAGGAHPTEEMLRIHLSLFNRSYQVLAVFDPDSGEMGWFGPKRAGEAFVNLPFSTFTDELEE